MLVCSGAAYGFPSPVSSPQNALLPPLRGVAPLFFQDQEACLGLPSHGSAYCLRSGRIVHGTLDEPLGSSRHPRNATLDHGYAWPSRPRDAGNL